MKSLGRGNRPWNKLAPTSSMEGLRKSHRCEFNENNIHCDQYFHFLPYHTGNRIKYCAKHREILAEREAEEWIKKDPKMAKYVNKELLLQQ